MLLESMMICSLLLSGGEDCSEKWEINIYDDLIDIERNCGKAIQGFVRNGCVGEKAAWHWEGHNFRYGMVSFASIYNDSEIRDPCGQTILEHELNHLKGMTHEDMATKWNCPEIIAGLDNYGH
ncbi:MAG TPA: hypothetical protein VD731_00110 [Nitrosopumilaceae archaeon]|nr:hypothetical protein [Nitrosopumilaceae archaeon]